MVKVHLKIAELEDAAPAFSILYGQYTEPYFMYKIRSKKDTKRNKNRKKNK